MLWLQSLIPAAASVVAFLELVLALTPLLVPLCTYTKLRSCPCAGCFRTHYKRCRQLAPSDFFTGDPDSFKSSLIFLVF